MEQPKVIKGVNLVGLLALLILIITSTIVYL